MVKARAIVCFFFCRWLSEVLRALSILKDIIAEAESLEAVNEDELGILQSTADRLESPLFQTLVDVQRQQQEVRPKPLLASVRSVSFAHGLASCYGSVSQPRNQRTLSVEELHNWSGGHICMIAVQTCMRVLWTSMLHAVVEIYVIIVCPRWVDHSSKNSCIESVPFNVRRFLLNFLERSWPQILSVESAFLRAVDQSKFHDGCV